MNGNVIANPSFAVNIANFAFDNSTGVLYGLMQEGEQFFNYY